MLQPEESGKECANSYAGPYRRRSPIANNAGQSTVASERVVVKENGNDEQFRREQKCNEEDTEQQSTGMKGAHDERRAR